MAHHASKWEELALTPLRLPHQNNVLPEGPRVDRNYRWQSSLAFDSRSSSISFKSLAVFPGLGVTTCAPDISHDSCAI